MGRIIFEKIMQVGVIYECRPRESYGIVLFAIVNKIDRLDSKNVSYFIVTYNRLYSIQGA